MKTKLIVAAVLCASGVAAAQPYPAKPIRLVTPYSPGGAGDWVARTATERMAQALGQQFVIEPRPGAGGNIAAESVVRSSADGYTLLFATPLLAINATLYRKLAFDATRDLVPVGVIATGPYVLYATGSLPVKNAGELVAMAKQKPGAINYASLGIGTGPHLGAVLLALAGGVEFTHVPYKGFGQALRPGAFLAERHRRGRRLPQGRPRQDARLHRAQAHEGVSGRADRLRDGPRL
jgi:tripartite-type tricarboxylate transporter receptor subunit TctC